MTTKTDPNQNYTINEFYIKVKGDYGKEKVVRVNDMGDKLLTLITDLGWDYQRMSMSGRQVYDEIQQLWYNYRRWSLHGDLNERIYTRINLWT